MFITDQHLMIQMFLDWKVQVDEHDEVYLVF